MTQDFWSEGFETANAITNFDFSQLYPFSVFTTTYASIPSISSVLTKSHLNHKCLLATTIAWVMISLEDSLCLIITGSTPVLITWMLIWLMQKQCFHHIMQHLLFKTLPWDVPIWPGLSLATLSLVFFFSSNSCIGIGCFLLQTLQVQCWLQFLVLWVLSIGFKHP